MALALTVVPALFLSGISFRGALWLQALVYGAGAAFLMRSRRRVTR